jgi:2-phospho-L-lactate guanylyltransferase (CobY/MobA/RfbA family)
MQSGLEQVVEGGDNVVSFQSELPLALQQAMVQFIERHPQLGSVPPRSGGTSRILGAKRY